MKTDNCRERETANRRCDNCRLCYLGIDSLRDCLACECRARPPRFRDGSMGKAFPPVERDWWCARFVARPNGDDGGLANILNLIERRKAERQTALERRKVPEVA